MVVIDPSGTLDDALEALFDNDDLDEAADKLTQLKLWLRDGGENPIWNQSRCEKMLDCILLLMEVDP